MKDSPASDATAPTTSHAAAFQPLRFGTEPSAPAANYSGETSMNRRTLMNMMVSTAIVGTAVTRQPHLGLAAEIDPIFAAIEAHKAAHAAVISACKVYNELDELLPAEVCKSNITAWHREIVETDAPEWIAATINQSDAHDAEIAAAGDLINVILTTAKGVVALLQYVVEVEKRIGEWWPRDDYEDEEIVGRNGDPRSFCWYHFLCRNALAGLNYAGEQS